MKNTLMSFTPAEISQYQVGRDVSRNLRREVDRNQMTVVVLACVSLLTLLALRLCWLSMQPPAPTGTAMDGSIVYYGGKTIEPAEAVELARRYREAIR